MARRHIRVVPFVLTLAAVVATCMTESKFNSNDMQLQLQDAGTVVWCRFILVYWLMVWFITLLIGLIIGKQL